MTRRSGALKTAALVVALLFGFALRGRAQSTEGYTDVMYDDVTDEILAFAVTYPDYETAYYYDPRVQVTLMKDPNVLMGQNVTVGANMGGGCALAIVSTPVEAGASYSGYAQHSLDIYYHYEADPSWYDIYGYGLLVRP